MKKIIAIILVIVAIAAIYYYTGKNTEVGDESNNVQPAALTGDVSTDLNNLEKENQSDVLDDSELDFGASVNAALQ